MKDVIDLINKSFNDKKNVSGNWESYEVKEYLQEIQNSLINQIKLIK